MRQTCLYIGIKSDLGVFHPAQFEGAKLGQRDPMAFVAADGLHKASLRMKDLGKLGEKEDDKPIFLLNEKEAFSLSLAWLCRIRDVWALFIWVSGTFRGAK